MTVKLTCTLPKRSQSYEIEIGSGLLHLQTDFLRSIASQFALITDDRMVSLYGESLYRSLTGAGLKVHLFSFPNGEQHKTAATKEALDNQMLKQGLGRDSAIIALGGGVVTDIAGFIASTYCRGIPHVMMPTSLLGMVDASIGGKTGINSPYGKNMIGSIYQPQKVVIDLLTLKTLPKKDMACGIVEMIKHGLIADKKLFEILEAHTLSTLDEELLKTTIFESCRIKKEIVEFDEKETGQRHLLNFGHTIAHALEQLTNYSLSHGEAVAIGIIVESYLAKALGILDNSSLERIRTILMRYGLPLQIPQIFPIKTLLNTMALDKKSVKGTPRFVLLKEIGSPFTSHSDYCTSVKESILIEALTWMNDNFCLLTYSKK